MRKERVLIIEDELDLLDLLDFNLTRKGFVTAGALDGVEGLAKAGALRPDLVILDLMLPGLDGWEVCRRLKEKTRDIKVLMLTAKCMPEDRVKGLETGADDYVTKPFSVKELIIRAGHLLAAKRQKDLRRTVMHEISNRITTLGAYSRLIEGTEDGNTAKKYMQSVCRQVDLTEELIHEAGIFLEADSTELQPSACDVHETLRLVAESYREEALSKGIEVRIRVEGPVEACIDHYALKQIVSNLLGNAVKYARPGGEIELSAKKPDGMVIVSVKDNGIGIPAADLPHVFDQGFRASNAHKAAKGSGFGLYIVKTLCERLGGRVDIHSIEGVGTEFIIAFRGVHPEGTV